MLLLSQLTYCADSKLTDGQMKRLDDLAKQLQDAKSGAEPDLRQNRSLYATCVGFSAILACVDPRCYVPLSVGCATVGVLGFSLSQSALSREKRTRESFNKTKKIHNELLKYSKDQIAEYRNNRVDYDSVRTDMLYFYDQTKDLECCRKMK